MIKEYNKKIVLEDGTEYYGYGFGADVEAINEIVFHTSMVGYQEIVSDPSYANQMVVMTYPLIGNYGITNEDYETKQPTMGGLIVKEYNDRPSNFRYTKTLSEILEENNIPAISGIDTRKLTRSIRDLGTRKVLITNIDTTKEEAMEKIKNYSIPSGVAEKVSAKKKWYSRTSHPKCNVVAVDCGIKLSVIKELNDRECNVTIVPYNVKYDEIEALKPDGIFISNGPGNPEDNTQTIELIKKLKGKYPIFGMGLGHQLISLAYGAKIGKLKFGHRGANHPVRNLETGKIEITNQNHGYVVEANSLKRTGLEITHINLIDETVEGVENKKDKIFTAQYSVDTQDSKYLLDKFIKVMLEK